MCVWGGVSTRGLHMSPCSLAVLYYLASSFHLSLGRMLGSLEAPLQREQGTGVTHSVQPPGWRITIT